VAWTLVTGGAKRLGADICLSLAQHGYDVVVHYNQSQQEAEDVAYRCQEFGVKAAAIQGDFSSQQTTLKFIHRYVEKFGNDTQHLINNVGNYLIKSALQTDLDEWTALFETNLHAPFLLIKNLLFSIRHYQGAIINLGYSGIQHVQANTYSTAYSITKLSLWMLTRSLAKELAPEGVRVNMVSPGYLDIAVDLPKDLTRLPMHRPAQCWEVSRVILFLLDPNSQYITGQNIEVAGGNKL
jgi:NAD(P)-dependent dehydrogenase (short-subunit alcohol dehydrogenase family)